MSYCPVCEDTGMLLDMPCPLCDDSDAHEISALLSDDDFRLLESAASASARDRIFRSLALRCHPDKFQGEPRQGEAARMFQKLTRAREKSHRLANEASTGSVRGKDCWPLCVLKQRDVAHGLAFSPDASVAVSCGDSGRLMVWKPVAGDWGLAEAHAKLQLETSTILATAFVGESDLAVTAGSGIEVWCLSTLAKSCAMTLDGRVLSLAAHNAQLAIGLEDGRVKLLTWCCRQKEFEHVTEFHHDPIVDAVSWELQGEVIAAVGGSSVSVWLQCGSTWHFCAALSLEQRACHLYSVDVVGGICAAGGTSGVVAVWDLSTAIDNPHGISGDEAEASTVCSSPTDGSSCFQEIDEDPFKKAVHDIGVVFSTTHSDDERVAVNCVSVSSDGRYLASGGTDARLLVWCLYSQAVVAHFTHRLPPQSCNLCTACINTCKFMPGGGVLAAGGYDGVITFWVVPQHESIDE